MKLVGRSLVRDGGLPGTEISFRRFGRSGLGRVFTFEKSAVTNEWGRGNAPGPFTSRPRFSAAGNALAFAVEFHGALADREVGGRLDLLHERRRLGVCLKLA